MEHIQDFESFLSESKIEENFGELFEASLAGKPQWRAGDRGDVRYSVGISYSGGKLPVFARASGLYTSGVPRPTSDIFGSDLGSSYLIITPADFIIAPDIAVIEDFLLGIRDFTENIKSNANVDMLKSKAVTSRIEGDPKDFKPNEVKKISVSLYLRYKPSLAKKMKQEQIEALKDQTAVLIGKMFRGATDIETRETKYRSEPADQLPMIAFTINY